MKIKSGRYGKLPMYLASVHFLFAICVFAVALIIPGLWGMIAIISLDYVNFPIQLVITFLTMLFTDAVGSPNATLAMEMILTFVAGTAWWYFLGTLIVRGWRRLSKKSATPVGNN
jgi:hypothetical protein